MYNKWTLELNIWPTEDTRAYPDIFKCSQSISEEILQPGVLKVVNKELLVGTASEALSIGFLTPAGKSRMDAKSWLNGARVNDGEFFG